MPYMVIVLLVCTACTTTQDINLPQQNAPEFSTSGTAALEDEWWVSFEDERLSSHIQKGLENNFSLAAAWDRVRAAKALARRESADLYPDLNLGTSADREFDDDAQDSSTFEFGPEASYEVDLWGRIRAISDAETLRAQATREDYRTAALILSGDIAITWYRLIEAHAQLDLLNRQIDTNEKVLEVLRARFGAGQVRSQDILRQQLLIEAIREDVIAFESRIDVLEHQLAVYQGLAPQSAKYTNKRDLPTLPKRPDAGIPANLIQRRPDIRRAYYNIQAADKDLAAAIRDRYPSLLLSASYLSETATAANLFSTWIATIAGSLIAPIIDGGERRAEVERSKAVKSELVNQYGQEVLEAFEEVENALIREKKQIERIDNLDNRLAIAKDTFDQIQTGYFNGANEYIAVLSALNEMQQIERNLLLAKRNLIEFRIALYRSLAGSFETPHENNNIKTAQQKSTENPDE